MTLTCVGVGIPMRGSRAAAAKLMREGTLAPPSPVLRTLFPAVEELRVELEFLSEGGWKPSSQLRILRPAARASFRYPCPFAGCNGWLELDEPVKNLVEGRKHSVAANLGCGGVRPRDRATGKTCETQVKYMITASYTRSKS
jgi:hypothetical protein